MHITHARRILAPVLVLLVVGFSGSSAWAIAVYDAFIDVTLSAPGPIPSGTGISLFTGTTLTPPPVEVGTAVAFNTASAGPPGTVNANASGAAVAPPTSLASSLGSATTTAALLNQNSGVVAFPLNISHIGLVQASTTEPDESAFAHWSFAVLFDGVFQPTLSLADTCSAPPDCSRSSVGSIPFSLHLPPGFHSLSIPAQAVGFALATEVVPEPTTLILVGTTMAGVGLARTMRRRG